MQNNTDKTLQLLKLLSNLGGGGKQDLGLRVVTIKTSDPYDVTLVMEGTDLALDLDIFEVPAAFYPLLEGDRLLAYPLINTAGGRWGLIAKLNAPQVTLATMRTGYTAQPDGSAATYEVIVPYGMTLAAGDRVAIAPTLQGGQIAYVVLNRYEGG